MKKKYDIKYMFFIVSLLIMGFVILDIPHGFEPVLFADSPAYLTNHLQEGIVPIYPLFIVVNRLIFTEKWYLQMVVLEQILFAIICSTLLVLSIKKKFNVYYWESYMFFLLTFVPYAVYLPEATSCRMIATEALAYPLFYLLIITAMKSVWTGKIQWILCTAAVALIMALTRTQLQLTLLIPAGAFFLPWIRGKICRKKWSLLTRVLLGFLGGGILFLFIYSLYQPSNILLQNLFVMANMEMEYRNDSQHVASEENGNTENRNLEVNIYDENISSQYNSVVFAKVMLTALEEDKNLFEDANMRDAYAYVYGRLVEEQKILVAMDKNLYIGDSIQGALGGMHRDVSGYLEEFRKLYPDKNISNAIDQFGAQLSKAHPFRWIIGCILQIPSGLISSVFFHKRSIYWFSYLVTIIVYSIAVGALFYHRKKFQIDVERRDFLSTTILINLLFVLATSIAFMDLQRYVTYGFGVFYISLYLVMRQLAIYVWSERFTCKKCP